MTAIARQLYSVRRGIAEHWPLLTALACWPLLLSGRLSLDALARAQLPVLSVVTLLATALGWVTLRELVPRGVPRHPAWAELELGVHPLGGLVARRPVRRARADAEVLVGLLDEIAAADPGGLDARALGVPGEVEPAAVAREHDPERGLGARAVLLAPLERDADLGPRRRKLLHHVVHRSAQRPHFAHAGERGRLQIAAGDAPSKGD
jgi:hypothetical protein